MLGKYFIILYNISKLQRILMNLKIKHNIDVKDLVQAINLDHKYFLDEDTIDINKCMSWFHKNNKIYIIGIDVKTQKVVAYINTMPLSEDVYKKYKLNKVKDVQLNENDILSYDNNTEINLLFTSIVILEEYRTKRNKKILLNQLYKIFYKLTKQNVYIKNILFDCVTIKGENFFRKRFKPNFVWRNEHSVLYELNFNPKTMENNPYKKALRKAYDKREKIKH
jgi:hypothetical protein